jgi:4-hydroxy-2-oxoheptanedioate aldolase
MGPADLAQALGIRGGPDHPDLLEAARSIAAAASRAGKAAGVVVPLPAQLELYATLGFTFLGCGSDTVMLVRETRRVHAEIAGLRDRLHEPQP